MADFELALGLAMYREQLGDANAHSDEWPPGMTSNLGELDMEAEMCIRDIWQELAYDEQNKLLRRAAEAVKARTERTEKLRRENQG